MEVVRDIALLERWHGCALVPTMGALHAGHTALIERATATGLRSLVSVFVNPTQFNNPTDLAQYPRDLERDSALAAEAGADGVFAPEIDAIYPPGENLAVPGLPPVATEPGLEDAFRPGHFSGVCQVVARLFDLTCPAGAVFGEKDFQQLRVIEEMVRMEEDRWQGLAVLSHPTVREFDGLAMSSRNVHLDEAARVRAAGLSRALHAAAELASPGRDARRIEEAMRAVVVRHGVDVEYAVVRDPHSLLPIEVIAGPARALIAGLVDGVRLIDNIALNA